MIYRFAPFLSAARARILGGADRGVKDEARRGRNRGKNETGGGNANVRERCEGAERE